MASCARKAAALSSIKKSVALRPGAPNCVADERPSLVTGERDLQPSSKSVAVCALGWAPLTDNHGVTSKGTPCQLGCLHAVQRGACTINRQY